MRTYALLLALFLVAGGAAAQEADREQPRPDYSRNTLLRLFAEAGDDDQRAIRYRDGAIEFRTLNLTWRMAGVLPPLSGTEFRTVMNQWPDPFALTRTSIATSPRAWRTQRARSAELRRIEATERAKLRVTTR